MRRRPIKVFQVQQRSVPGERPQPRHDLQLHAEGRAIDTQRENARKQLAALGLSVRSISNSPTGEIVAYVFPAVPSTPRSRRTVQESAWNGTTRHRGRR